MPPLLMVGGPRDGDEYKAPDGYREMDYYGDIRVPYIEGGVTKFATYRRAWETTPQKTKRPLNEMHYAGED